MLSHSFLLLGALSLALLAVPPRRAMALFWAVAYFLTLLTVLTHRWVHYPPAELPAWFRALQASGLLMGHEHHMRHHVSLETQFSNLSGVTDGLLDAVATRLLPPHLFEHWLSFIIAWYAGTVLLGSEALREWCAERRARKRAAAARGDVSAHVL